MNIKIINDELFDVYFDDPDGPKEIASRVTLLEATSKVEHLEALNDRRLAINDVTARNTVTGKRYGWDDGEWVVA